MNLILLIHLIKIWAALLLYLEVNLKAWILLNFKVKAFAAIIILSVIVLAATSIIVALLDLNYRNIILNWASDSFQAQLIVC